MHLALLLPLHGPHSDASATRHKKILQRGFFWVVFYYRRSSFKTIDTLEPGGGARAVCAVLALKRRVLLEKQLFVYVPAHGGAAVFAWIATCTPRLPVRLPPRNNICAAPGRREKRQAAC
jgi:hypothetical protein